MATLSEIIQIAGIVYNIAVTIDSNSFNCRILQERIAFITAKLPELEASSAHQPFDEERLAYLKKLLDRTRELLTKLSSKTVVDGEGIGDRVRKAADQAKKGIRKVFLAKKIERKLVRINQELKNIMDDLNTSMMIDQRRDTKTIHQDIQKVVAFRFDDESKEDEPDAKAVLYAKLAQRLRSRYSQFRLRLLEGSTLDIPFEDLFVNVAVVKEEEQKEKEAKLSRLSQLEREGSSVDSHTFRNGTSRAPLGILGDYEDIHRPKEPIELDELFEYEPEGLISHSFTDAPHTPRKIALLGRPGVGKTTLTRYIAHQWAQEELFNEEFDYVFLFPLKELISRCSSSEHWTMPKLLYAEFLEALGFSEAQAREFWEENQNRTLILLDGYDEVMDHQHPLVEEVLLKEPPYLLVTARPYAGVALQTDMVLESLGFSDDNIAVYIDLFCAHDSAPPERADALKRWLAEHPNVKGICHIPINLELLCTVFFSKFEAFQNADLSMTDLYSLMVDKLIRRYLEKYRKKEVSNPRLFTPRGLLTAPSSQAVVQFLERLAFTGLCTEQRQILLSGETIQKLIDKQGDPLLFEKIQEAGFLKKVGEHSNPYENDYYFLHFSLQEFFAARYIALNLENPEIQQFIQHNKYNPVYQLILSYVAGVLFRENQTAMNQFFELLLSEPRDLLGLYELELLMACMEEAGYSDAIAIKSQLLTSMKAWLKFSIIQKNYAHSIFSLLKQFPRMGIELRTNDQFFIQNLLEMPVNAEFFISNHYFLQLIIALLPDQIDILIIMLGNSNPWVCIAVVKKLDNLSIPSDKIRLMIESSLIALKNASETEAFSEIAGLLEDLAKKLYDARLMTETEWLDVIHASHQAPRREAAIDGRAYYLERLEQLYPEGSLIEKPLARLKFPEAGGSLLAIDALGKLSIPPDKVELVIDALLPFLQNLSEKIRVQTIETLSRLPVSFGRVNVVIEGLLISLMDSDGFVRKAAIKALMQFSVPPEYLGQLVEKLLIFLKDADPFTCETAIMALGKLPMLSEQMDLAIEELLAAMRSSDASTREIIIETLSQLSIPPKWMSLIVEGLLFALIESPDLSTALKKAVSKLLTLSEHIILVIERLLIYSTDSNHEIRTASALLLCQFPIPAQCVTSVVKALIFVLQNSSSRYAFNEQCKFEQLSIPLECKDVLIDELLFALDSPHEEVCVSAAMGLCRLSPEIAELSIPPKWVSSLVTKLLIIIKNLSNTSEKAIKVLAKLPIPSAQINLVIQVLLTTLKHSREAKIKRPPPVPPFYLVDHLPERIFQAVIETLSQLPIPQSQLDTVIRNLLTINLDSEFKTDIFDKYFVYLIQDYSIPDLEKQKIFDLFHNKLIQSKIAVWFEGKTICWYSNNQLQRARCSDYRFVVDYFNSIRPAEASILVPRVVTTSIIPSFLRKLNFWGMQDNGPSSESSTSPSITNTF